MIPTKCLSFMWPYSRREPPIRDGFAKMQMVYNNYTLDQLGLPDHICTFLNLEDFRREPTELSYSDIL